jgi:transcriptional regulator with XRE-family HTH domain
MALGEILKNAREQRGLTPSAVAESTHLKVQVVEDLEREDFKRIAAPIYGRGFVKLYAEFMQLDPEPLIRDFMELFAGDQVPAVRMRRSEAPAEPTQPERSPVTRTVTGAASQPQRQPVQARPAVRPLSSPLSALRQEEGASGKDGSRLADLAEEDVAADYRPVTHEERGEFVVTPEESEAEQNEPDLFRPQRVRRRPVVIEGEDGADGTAVKKAPDGRVWRTCKLPVFKIGGRQPSSQESIPQDEALHARKSARMQAFLDGVRKLKSGVERNLPDALPRKRVIALCGAGVALAACMAVGIGLLFRMTGSNVHASVGTVVESVASVPSLYVD